MNMLHMDTNFHEFLPCRQAGNTNDREFIRGNSSKISGNSRQESLFHILFNHKAQVMLEFTFCFIIVCIFLIASFRAFVWIAQTFVGRQKAFQSSSTAFSFTEQWPENFYQPEKMNLIPAIR